MCDVQRKLIFFGELPPSSVNGVSISNYRVLQFLNERFDVCSVEERAALDTRGLGFFQKAMSLLKPLKDLYSVARGNDIFYCNLALSRLGVIKVVLLVLVVRFRSPKSKVILHLHRGDVKSFLSTLLNKVLFNLILRVSYRIICLSAGIKESIAAVFPLGEKKLFVGLNTVDVPNFGLDEYLCFEYLYISNYLQTKGIKELILNLNESLPLLRLNAYGGVSDKGFYNSLTKVSNENITLNGPLTGVAKFKCIGGSKVLVMPSLNEGMPLIILESLSQGTPVICFDVGAIKEYLGADYLGLVGELTYKAFIEKIKEIESLSDLDYLKLRKVSKELFWSKYSPEHSKKQLVGIFEVAK